MKEGGECMTCSCLPRIIFPASGKWYLILDTTQMMYHFAEVSKMVSVEPFYDGISPISFFPYEPSVCHCATTHALEVTIHRAL